MTTLDRRLTPARPDLAAERLRGIVEAARFVAGTARRVATPSCPLRREPRADGPLDTEALMGEAVTVYEEAGGFAWAQLGQDGYVGYLPADALAEPGPAPTHAVAALRTFRYPGPSMKLAPAAFLSLGSRLTVAGETAGYAELASGGFVFAGHLRPVGIPAPDFVAVAELFLETPYLWGGRTSLGIDCSGLVQVALLAAGIPCPRDSDMQAGGLGLPLALRPDLGGLRRGDLVFWRGHVGIMRDAERLLHANAHTMTVATEPLAEAESRIRARSFGPITGVRRLPGPR